MKKLLSVVLALALVLALGTVSAFAAVGDKYDALADFDHEKNDASNVPWMYFITSDGTNFEALTSNETRDYEGKEYKGWFIATDDYCGVGKNIDRPTELETNQDGEGRSSAIAFVAPNDGEFKITGTVTNAFGQPASTLKVKKNAEEVLSEAVEQEEGFVVNINKTLSLKAGDRVYFFGTGATGWASLYFDIEVEEVEAPAASEEPNEEEPPQTGDSSVVMFVVLGLAALTGIVVLSRKLRFQ